MSRRQHGSTAKRANALAFLFIQYPRTTHRSGGKGYLKFQVAFVLPVAPSVWQTAAAARLPYAPLCDIIRTPHPYRKKRVKTKQIALLILAATALSGCSVIQSVASAADSALGAVSNGLDSLQVALGGQSSKSGGGRRANTDDEPDESTIWWRKRRQENASLLNMDYYRRNKKMLDELLSQHMTLTFIADSYAKLDDEITGYNEAIAGRQRGKTTYRPPKYYDECTHYTDYFNGRGVYVGRDCHESVTMRYTAEEQRAEYQAAMSRYNQDISTLQHLRAEYVQFVEQHFGSVRNLKNRLAQNRARLIEVTRRLNSHCSALMNGQSSVVLRVRGRTVQQRDNSLKTINEYPVQANSIFCGRDLVAKAYDLDQGRLDFIYARALAGAEEQMGIKPVAPRIMDPNRSFGLLADDYDDRYRVRYY